MSTLYKRHYYVNKSILDLVNEDIVEYDMKSAELSMIKHFNLLDEKTIKLLEILPKKDRNIKIGTLKKHNKTLVKTMNQGYIEFRQLFIDKNNLQDEDIISIKKDAIFTTKRCKYKDFDNIHFDEKNTYTSYYYFPEVSRIELYYNKEKLDVKGIQNENLKPHSDYMCSFFKRYAYMNEMSTKANLIKFINEFSYFYRTRQLDKNYYREFNASSKFRLFEQIGGKDVAVGNADDIKVEDIDIVYNFFAYIVPLIERMI